MSDDPEPCQATPNATLREQIMDSRIPKNEREWWASHHIKELERDNAMLRQSGILSINEIERQHQAELAALRRTIANSNYDWADDLTHLQNLCVQAGISPDVVHGNSYAVPGITELADLLAKELTTLRAELEKTKKAFAPTFVRELHNECLRLERENDTLRADKARLVGELENVQDDLRADSLRAEHSKDQSVTINIGHIHARLREVNVALYNLRKPQAALGGKEGGTTEESSDVAPPINKKLLKDKTNECR